LTSIFPHADIVKIPVKIIFLTDDCVESFIHSHLLNFFQGISAMYAIVKIDIHKFFKIISIRLISLYNNDPSKLFGRVRITSLTCCGRSKFSKVVSLLLKRGLLWIEVDNTDFFFLLIAMKWGYSLNTSKPRCENERLFTGVFKVGKY
jgi:hypothetical protein